jgi:hypothetical protein
MELLLFAALVLLAVGAALARRHYQSTAWDRELDEAFGVGSLRELSRHRTL